MAGAAVLAAGLRSWGTTTANATAQPGRTVLMPPPIGWAGETPGDGFAIGHGFACENTWFNPGWWHTGEDWYAVDRDTGDALIYAVAAGEVVYAGYDYPGRVIIIRHADDLFSVYGHLNFDTPVAEGQEVDAGEEVGSVLLQADGRAPSHLHFEFRTFLMTSRVNGDNPSYGVNCGPNCPPGPGYWPIDAPEHPADMGWRNPTHQQAELALETGIAKGLVVRAQSAADGHNVDVHADPGMDSDVVAELPLTSGDSYALLDISAGEPASIGTSADAYAYWLRIAADDLEGWVQAAIPSDRETGSDGRPSALDRPFLILPGQ
jgi:murein DD-endopeptidase MepM/ murein hydrolase activator NlpD